MEKSRICFADSCVEKDLAKRVRQARVEIEMKEGIEVSRSEVKELNIGINPVLRWEETFGGNN